MLFSVIICTYNRSSLLRDCIDTLVVQEVDMALFEVIIVNNNSTDNTITVVEKFVEIYPNIRLLLEEKQGLGHARNRGWHEAKGRYVAYIDDDAKAHRDWIYEMYQFTLRHPEIQAFGGPYFPFSHVVMPDWMPENFGKNYKGEKERSLDIGKEWISGSNMVFTRKLLEKIRGFDTDLGMKGNKISYGEETVLLRKISNLGEPIYYAPKIRVDHLVAEYKMNFRWILRSYYAHGRCSARVNLFERPIGHYFHDVWRVFRKCCVEMVRSNRRLTKKIVLSNLIPVFFQFGRLIEKIMIMLKIESIAGD